MSRNKIIQEKIKGIYVVGGPQDTDFNLELFYSTIEKLFQGGIKIFQLRIKEKVNGRDFLSIARTVKKITQNYDVTYFINDRPDLAVIAEADGLHLGPEDMRADEARKIVGDMIIGMSNHSFDEFIENKDHPQIDYLSIGPIFPTTSKIIPDPVVGLSLLEKCLPLLKANLEGNKKPVVAIGGINRENVQDVFKTGVDCVGVIQALMKHPRPYQGAKEFLNYQ